MVKKLILALMAMLLLLTGCACAQGQQVVDAAGEMTAEEIAVISEVIDDIEEKYQVDVVVLVTDKTPTLSYYEDNTRVENYGHDFYDYGGYGMGEDASGMLYMIDVKNRIQTISGSGKMMLYITDEREEAIFDVTGRYLRVDDWGGASLAAGRKIRGFMGQGIPEGAYLYDEVTGQIMTVRVKRLEFHEVLLAVLGGVVAAAILFAVVSSSYGMKGSTYTYDMASQASCSITEADEQFLRESVSRVARSTSSSGGSSGGHRSGGSGVRISSSGRSHSGGSRRF